MKELVAPVVLVALLAACGGDSSGVKIPDTTKVLDEETLQALESVSTDLQTFTFSSGTPQLDTLAVDDVMVADIYEPVLPYGTLRRVVAIDRTGPGVVVTAGPASLTDAIEQGSLSETIPLRMDNLVDTTAPAGVVPYIGPGGITFGLNDVVLFDGDGDSATVGDQVVLDGNISVRPDLEVVFDISGFSLKEATVAVTTEVSGNLNVDARREAVLPPYEKDLATLTFTPIAFFVGPVPVVIVPTVTIQVGVDGKVTAKMNAGVMINADARLGFGYSGGSFGPIAEMSPTASLELQSFQDGVAGQVRIWGGARADLKLYGMAGGFAKLKAFVRADVDASANPWWCLAAGVEGTAGVTVAIDIDFWLFDIHIDLIDYETPPLTSPEIALGCASGPAPSADTGGEAVQTWARSYGGDNIDFPVSLVPMSTGGTLIVGASNSFSSTPVDAWLVKVDALGHLAWEIAYADLEAAIDALEVGDGLVVATGRAGTSPQEMRLLGLDVNGTPTWAEQLEAPNGLAPAQLAKTQDGGLAVFGTHGISSQANFWAARFDGQGNLLWSKEYDGGGEDDAYAGIATSDGGFLIVGTTKSFGISFNATWALRIDGSGEIVWQRLFDGPGNEWGYFAVESPLGGYLIGGHNADDALLWRLDSNGAVVWNRSYDGGTTFDNAYAATVDSSGNFLIGGKIELGDAEDLWLLEVADDGNPLWSRAFGGALADDAAGLAPAGWGGHPLLMAPDGAVLAAGITQSFGAGAQDIWLLAVAPNGFVDLDLGGGATSTALTGAFASSGIGSSDTAVAAQPLTLTVTDAFGAIAPFSTDAITTRQGGLE